MSSCELAAQSCEVFVMVPGDEGFVNEEEIQEISPWPCS